MATEPGPCPDCGANVGELHDPGCDVERCPRCGGQSISCNCIYEFLGMDPDRLEDEHPDVYRNGPTSEMAARWGASWGHRRLPWTGEWPGVAECVEFGWYSRRADIGPGWVRCGKGDPGAVPDLNRLGSGEAVWDAGRGRFVLRCGQQGRGTA